MEKVAIQIREPNGTARIKEPVGLGIPVPKGTVRNAQQLALMDGDKPLTVQLQPLAHWPDGSIRWVHVSTLVDLAPNSQKDLVLAHLKTPSPSTTKAAVSQTAGGLQITTATGSVILQPDSLAWQVRNPNDEVVPSAVILSDDAGAPCTAKAESNWEITHKGPVLVAATLKGQWIKQTNEPLARFECELRIFLETGLVQLELVTHNPKRARHPGGLWDLGDPGSVHFHELAVETAVPGTSTAKVTPQATDVSPSVLNLADFNLYQDSSGGENWQSRNHVDANGEVTTQFCGYRLTSAGKLEREGKRANPLVSIEHDSGQLELAVPHFWQNFPTSLRKEGNKVTAGLFPKDSKSVYELQGGERKTLRCLMSYQGGTSLSAMAYTPLAPIIAPECYERAEAFPWFKANTQPGPLDHLIAEGLEGESNFFAKREVIDEFGWRNFGDIFADHETLYQAEGEEPFISHYNNQYDAICGFARQFALTGDSRWFELMDDLASHVADIDIYHTEEDRAEYNNGLFWHTDHYLDAYTATHRTFSKHNDTSSTPGQTGGGPAAEHCYTTGLLYHHYLTGSQASRDAVLQLANWIRTWHEGQGGLLEQILALKKHDLPMLKALVKGQRPSAHQYPFTRGTGNYLNALLDASLLEPGENWLNQAEVVISKTIHPADNIEIRNLLDVETGWSYLILMTSIARYLHIKREFGKTDAHFNYARDAFMHYAHWMLENERPFLSDPEQLEFPNDTWVAQDIRKAMLMFQAAELNPPNAKAFQDRGSRWLTEICETLTKSEQKHYSRILIILMQNYGAHQTGYREGVTEELTGEPSKATPNKLPILTWGELLARVVTRLVRGALTFRPSKERAWIQARLDRT
ncbi:hypothetical protein [Marinobacter xiaoshiensis]|uniref:PcRGLX/YetA-like N-terminal RIFT barrel domain-containing protein n=1 Tax=Marinobacter xiaoshiensis TaxID=3073652 RepID=A0ABU2HH53_9GAMM|nr:hypothetical protein [Marinobacter sp. F60267]MDS1309941.1 hypothetical protein [Marinobacter sp. F60267]